LHTFIHSVAYSIYAFQEGGGGELAEYYMDTYLRWGAVVCPTYNMVNFF
jgi:hypothetical protein